MKRLKVFKYLFFFFVLTFLFSALHLAQAANNPEQLIDSFDACSGWNIKVPIVSATASSFENASLPAERAIDGDMGTRWSSQFSDPQWIMVDLGQKTTIEKVVLCWEAAYGKSYKIQISDDARKWTDVYSAINGDGGVDEIEFEPVTARYVRMYGIGRATECGYSLYEFEVIATLPVAGVKLTTTKGFKGNCLYLNYDLGPGKFYVVVSKGLPLSLPENYEFIFYIKGVPPDNNLEFKLIDENGNTYWKTWGDFKFSKDWKKIVVKKDDISYAGGPKPGVELAKVKSIEFAISGGKGGEGEVCIDELTLVSLPASKEILKNPYFEKGAANWEKSGNAKYIEPYDWHHYGGKWSYGIGNDNGPENAYGEVSQEIKVPGEIKEADLFTFKMWVECEDKYTGKASLKIEFLDSDNKLLKSCQSKPLSGKFKWTKVTVKGEAPQGAKKVIVKFVSKDMSPGKGGSFIWFDNASIVCPIITASSALKDGFTPANVMKEGEWHSEDSDNQWLEIDFREIKKFTDLSIDWDKDYAKDYEILISDDEKKWNSIYKAVKDKEGPDKIYFDETYAQFIKVNCNKSSTGNGFGIKEIELMDSSEPVTLKKYYEILAEQSPAYYPRWLLKNQAYWTGVGVEGDENEAIICEDGTIEPHKRGFTIMPFLYVDNKLITRDDATITQSLENAYLPIPSVQWGYDDLEMSIKLFAYGEIDESVAYAWYKIENKRKDDVSGKLFLTIRPLQIFPPWQGGGGFSSIHKIEYLNNIVTVNDKFKIFPLIKPATFGSIAGNKYFKLPFKAPAPPELEGDITCFIKKGVVPTEKNVEDTDGFVSSALGYDFKLEPGENKEFFIAMPLHNKMPSLNATMKETRVRAEFKKMLEENIVFWESKVNKVAIDIPEIDIVNTLKSNIAYNLITKDGPALQPGSRSYDKSWMRDGGMAAAALLRMGLTSEVRDFIDWFSGFQYENGLVPPIIDTKAEDPLWEEKPPCNLIEYDSQGEFIYVILQYYYFTKDEEFLKGKLAGVKKAAEYLVYLRNQTLTPEFKDGPAEKRKYYGILPPSTSHEGYGCEYSYWDDFWALKGWKDARTIFAILGRDDLVEWADKEYKDFKKCFYDSLMLTMKFYNIDYIPASASLGDFDPTSTAVAIMYCDELENLPQPQLKDTFDKYYSDLSSRFKPDAKYRFVPYELRSAPAFLYMGQKEKALDLLRFMLKCRRPLNWNQLAEVVHSDYRFPDYFGDMPHTWVGAEYINTVRSLFAYEKEGKLVLGHGIDEEWLLSKQGISVSNLPTYYGEINYTLRKENNVLKIKIWGKVSSPPDGFVFKLPWAKEIKKISIDEKEYEGFSGEEVVFYKLPVEIAIIY